MLLIGTVAYSKGTAFLLPAREIIEVLSEKKRDTGRPLILPVRACDSSLPSSSSAKT